MLAHRTIAFPLRTIKETPAARLDPEAPGCGAVAAAVGALVSDPLAVLIVTTVVTAALHTLIPDHWLPFVLVARSETWTHRRTIALTAASAALHVVVSLGLGLATHVLGRGAGEAVGLGEILEHFASLLLIAFGLLYAGWFLLKGGHQHSFGMHPHHEPDMEHPSSVPHPHDMPHGKAGDGIPSGAPTAGEAFQPRGGLALAAIVGFNPCVLIIPYIYMAGSMSLWSLVLVAGAFALSTIGCMVGVVHLGLRGTARLESRFLMRYGEVVSGGLIALTGLLVMLFGGH